MENKSVSDSPRIFSTCISLKMSKICLYGTCPMHVPGPELLRAIYLFSVLFCSSSYLFIMFPIHYVAIHVICIYLT